MGLSTVPPNRRPWPLLISGAALLLLSLTIDARFSTWLTSDAVYPHVYTTLIAITQGAGALILIAVLSDRFDGRQWLGCLAPILLTGLLTHLPTLLGGLDLTRQDRADIEEGGFCLTTNPCLFPKCPCGK